MPARVRESLGILVPARSPAYPTRACRHGAPAISSATVSTPSRARAPRALAKDPDEPTLHLLSAQVYETTGLTDLAQREFVDARDLAARR